MAGRAHLPRGEETALKEWVRTETTASSPRGRPVRTLRRGAGGPYNCFAGIDCSRALAKVSLEPADLNADCADLQASERDVLDDWVVKFESKYPFVGRLTNGTYVGAG